MNRRKHPERAFRRKAATGDRTRGGRTWRITATWPERTDRRTTTDRKARNRMIGEHLAQGAHVVVEEARGFTWRPWREYDGPALIAEATAAAADRDRIDQAAADERAQRHAADYAKQTARNTDAATLDATDARDRLARLMAQPPAPRDQRARHTAGGR